MPIQGNKHKSRITYLRVRNYRSLGESTEVRFGRLTALVGVNGSGKSNICDALRFIADALKIGLEGAIAKRHGIGSIRRWSAGRPFNISMEIHVDFLPIEDTEELADPPNLTGQYAFEIGVSKSDDFQVNYEWVVLSHSDAQPTIGFLIGGQRWKHGPEDLRLQVAPLGLALPLLASDERFQPLAASLRGISIYSIFPDTLRKPQIPDNAKLMTEHGGNWNSILRAIKKAPESNDLIAAIGQLTGDIDGFQVKQAGPYLITEFRHGESSSPGKNGKHRPRWFAAAQESDGTLRMAGILTALLQSPPPSFLGIEEPELTVHPGALPLLYDHIKEASQRGQVILTTHSPDLLSLLNADEIRVVERHNGVTTVAPMDEAQRQAVHDRLFTPGELLRMEGLKQTKSIKTPQET